MKQKHILHTVNTIEGLFSYWQFSELLTIYNIQPNAIFILYITYKNLGKRRSKKIHLSRPILVHCYSHFLLFVFFALNCQNSLVTPKFASLHYLYTVISTMNLNTAKKKKSLLPRVVVSSRKNWLRRMAILLSSDVQKGLFNLFVSLDYFRGRYSMCHALNCWE
jgi:hypothetical protein